VRLGVRPAHGRYSGEHLAGLRIVKALVRCACPTLPQMATTEVICMSSKSEQRQRRAFPVAVIGPNLQDFINLKSVDVVRVRAAYKFW
jgi:hypothetical protein